MSDLAWIAVSALLINNFVLANFLGLCSFIGVSNKFDPALRLGLATTFVMVVTAVCTWLLNRFVLQEAPYLRVIAFIVVIASMVQIVEMLIKKTSPVLFRELGIYLPLITTNCAILGLAVIQTNRNYNFLQGTVFGLAAGLGFTLVMILMSSIRVQTELAKVPKVLQGPALVFLLAATLAMAFMGFAGLFS
jgi:Na+-translocating ferredoxin:NAD+ oxidoreductase subunit A